MKIRPTKKPKKPKMPKMPKNKAPRAAQTITAKEIKPMKTQRKNPRLAKKARLVCEKLEEIYPVSECALEYGGDPWKLLVMARLSAQCTDARVNIVSRELFAEFPDAKAMAEGDISKIEELVRPCGLYRSKAASIKDFSKTVTEELDGKIPDTMEGLIALSGVGRKIANLILGDVYGKGGIVADTHCMRICARLGFYKEGKKDPLFTETVMDKYVEKDKQSDFCHRIVFFGREWCKAANPRCSECPLSELCDKYKKSEKRPERK